MKTVADSKGVNPRWWWLWEEEGNSNCGQTYLSNGLENSLNFVKKGRCNLFTHGAPGVHKNSFETECPCILGSNWNLKMLVF